MIKNKKIYLDGVIGVILFIFSLIMLLIIIPAQVSDVIFGRVGFSPSMFPKVSVVCIGLFSLMLIVDNFLLKRQTKVEKIENRGLIAYSGVSGRQF